METCTRNIQDVEFLKFNAMKQTLKHTPEAKTHSGGNKQDEVMPSGRKNPFLIKDETRSEMFMNVGKNSPCISPEQWTQSWRRVCSLVQDGGYIHEISANKLYLVFLTQYEGTGTEFCQSINELPKPPFVAYLFEPTHLVTYEPFNLDFGPYNLSATHLFCSKLKIWLDTLDYRDENGVMIVIDSKSYRTRLNGTLLTCIAAMVLLGCTDDQVCGALKNAVVRKDMVNKEKLLVNQGKRFDDVSGIRSSVKLTLEDCIRAFYHALKIGFYKYYEFDQIDYLFYELVSSGDLNWVLPGKILAFAGPTDSPFNSKGYQKHNPGFYHDYFRDHNVTDIVRLNDAEYDSKGFTDAGFLHHDLIFPDGFPPTSTIATKFFRLVDNAKGAVAVHCYAGIGRTGTLIAAYLVRNHRFTPKQAIAWTRMCRPGSVIGEQQDWLLTYFEIKRFLDSFESEDKQEQDEETEQQDGETEGSSSSKTYASSQDTKVETDYAIHEKEKGQAFALVQTKKQRMKVPSSGPVTRSSKSARISKDGGETSQTSQKSNLKMKDVILDLGKTIPIQFYHRLILIDCLKLKAEKNPDHYLINDGRYDWKVKFPKSDYVELQLSLPLDEDPTEDEKDIVDEPHIFCVHSAKKVKTQFGTTLKKKPIMYYGKPGSGGPTTEVV